MKKVEAYQCDWCGKVSRTVQGMRTHERNCHHNPEFKCCENCVHGCLKCVPKDTHRDYDIFDVLDELVYEPYCKYHEQFIFCTNKSENAYFIECETQGYHDDQPVPYTCWCFESKGRHGFEKEEGETHEKENCGREMPVL